MIDIIFQIIVMIGNELSERRAKEAAEEIWIQEERQKAKEEAWENADLTQKASQALKDLGIM